MPSSAFLMSPYADLTLSGDSIVDKRAVDRLFTEEVLRMRVSDYVAGGDPSNPFISPVFGDLRGLPPMLIQVGSHELLLSDALRLATRAAQDDVAVFAPSLSQSGSRSNFSATRDAATRTSLDGTNTASTSAVALRVS
jgi:acetyl esterase/lipase